MAFLELDDFLLELDEDVEGMQNTIYYLQQQLKEAKEQIIILEQQCHGTVVSNVNGDAEFERNDLSASEEMKPE